MARRRTPKRDTTNLEDQRVGLYCRVSQDREGDEKSVDDQEAVGREWVERVGGILEERHIYRDADRSASRFATKQREEFERLLADIENGDLDVVWFWELSRSQRRLDVFAKLRDICRDFGVLWVIRDRVYDPDDNTDMLSTGIQAIISENESEMTSQRVTRGKKSSAFAGRPGAKAAYGYKRIYDPETRAWLRDEPDDSDGEDSPAFVVREIFERVAGGEAINLICRDLNERGITSPKGRPWDNSKLRFIAMSPTYIAKRVYQAAPTGDPRSPRSNSILDGVEVNWPALVDEETYWRVQRILTDPTRRTTRLGPRSETQHLCSSIAVCDKCGGKLAWKQNPAPLYFCRVKNDVNIRAQPLDDYVEGAVIRWLSDPRTVAELTGEDDDDSVAAKQARADVERARVQLAQLYADVEALRVSPTIATKTEQRLLDVIDAAEHRVETSTLPPVLRGNIGPNAKAGWDALDMPAKRLILRTIADIRVRPTGSGNWKNIEAKDRVDIDLLGERQE